MGLFSLGFRREAGLLGAAALLALTLAFAPHFFAARADQGPTRCGADQLQLPVAPHPNAFLALTPGAGAQSSVFNAGVLGMNTSQGDQPADLIWDEGQANEQVLTFGTYANGADSISIDGQVPANADRASIL